MSDSFTESECRRCIISIRKIIKWTVLWKCHKVCAIYFQENYVNIINLI